MKIPSVAILIYGEPNSGRNALVEEKYKDLVERMIIEGLQVSSVLYSDEVSEQLRTVLLQFNAVLVWVNPIEQGNNRNQLDSLLREIAAKGVFVSTHPDIILKMGTKEVLYTTRNMGWSGDIKMYTSFSDFVTRFPEALKTSGTRILKQYRGNGGNGVFKIVAKDDYSVLLTHAADSNKETFMSLAEVYDYFQPFFFNNGLLVDQEWNQNTINGMVRCYVSGTKVSGFGYQEINALYELNNSSTDRHYPPSKRYYFTENCGLFSDLKKLMEDQWIPQLQQQLSISADVMPVIWDADFFINHINSDAFKYSLCEINVSCVSPFPPSAIQYIVEVVKERLKITIPL